MSMSSQDHADLAKDACNSRKLTVSGDDPVPIGRHQYKVLDHYDNPRTGYQGTIYQRVDTDEIIVAHRGTEFDREALKDGLLADGGTLAQVTAHHFDLRGEIFNAYGATSAHYGQVKVHATPQEIRTLDAHGYDNKTHWSDSQREVRQLAATHHLPWDRRAPKEVLLCDLRRLLSVRRDGGNLMARCERHGVGRAQTRAHVGSFHRCPPCKPCIETVV